MNQLSFPYLSLIIFLPLLGAVVVALLPARQTQNIRRTALGFSLLTFVLSLGLYVGFDSTTARLQFVDRVEWIPALGIRYYVGLDGISLLLVLLTTLLSAVSILSTWKAIDDRVKEFMVSMLLLETALLGVFSAIDLVAFFVFWEASIIPMYFIIGDLGRSTARLRDDQVRAVHDGRQCLHAHRHPGPRVHLLQGPRRVDVRSHAVTEPRSAIRDAGLDVPGLCPGLRDQGTALPGSTPGCPTLTWKRRPPAA